MKNIILILLTFSITTFLSAQSISDALRFSQIESASTARMAGIGGGMSALGGEFSVINVNPAGLAIYRSSEFSITPSLDLRETTGTLGGRNEPETENASAFNFNNIGVVLNSKPGGKWRTSNFAIGYNRIANFKENFNFEGQSSGSIADQFLELATGPDGVGIPPGELDDFLAGPAFDAFAIGEVFDFTGNPTGEYFNDFQDAEPGAEIQRLQSLRRQGSINELSLSLAGNYRNKFLIGGTVGIPILNYTQSRDYEEFDPGTGPDGNIPFFENLQFTDTLNTSGVGVNVKIGMIYWPTPKVRIGAAVHTPTFYSLTDYYDTSVSYTLTEDGVTESRNGAPFEPRNIDYGFRTPWRFVGSGGLIIPKVGLLSVEVEYVNYEGSSYNLDKDGNSDFDTDRGDAVNTEINNELQSALNIRVGAEYMINRFLVRAGYNWLGNAYVERDASRSRISLGGGFRADRYYLDLAYVRGTTESEYSPYNLQDNSAEQIVSRELASNKILFTFGYRF